MNSDPAGSRTYLPAAVVLRSPPPALRSVGSVSTRYSNDAAELFVPQRPSSADLPQRRESYEHHHGGSAVPQSVALVLQQELESASRAIEVMENDKLSQIKEMSTMRLDEERKRLALQNAFDNEIALCDERWKLKLRMMQEDHERALQNEKVRSTEFQTHAHQADQLLAQAQAKSTECLAAAQRAELRADAAEAEVARSRNEAAQQSRALQGQVEALNAVLDKRASELALERSKTNEALAAVDDAKLQTQDAIRHGAAVERELGEAQVLIAKLQEENLGLARIKAALQVKASDDADAAANKLRAQIDEGLRLEADAIKVRDELRNKANTISRLEGIIADLNEANGALERKLARALEDKSALTTKVDSDRLNLMRQQEQLQQCEAQLATEAVNRANLEQRINMLNLELSEAKSTTVREAQVTSALRSEIDDLHLKQRRIAFLEEQLGSAQAALDRASADSSTADRRLNEARNHIAALDQAVAEARAAAGKTRELESELALARDRLTERTRLADRLRDELQRTHQDLERSQADTKALQLENTALIKEVDGLRAVRDELDAERARKAVLEGRIAKAEQTIAARVAEYQSMVSTHEALSKQLAEREAQLSILPTLKRRLEQEEAEGARHRQQLQSVNSELRDAHTENQRFSSLNEQLQEEFASTKSELSAAQAAIQELQSQLADRDQLRKLGDDRLLTIDALKTEVERHQNRIVALESEVRSIQDQQGVSEEQRAALKRTIAEGNKTIEELQLQLGRRLVATETAEKSTSRLQVSLRDCENERNAFSSMLNEAKSLAAEIAAERDKMREDLVSKTVDLERAQRDLRELESCLEEANKHRLNAEAREQALNAEMTSLRGAYTKSTVLEGKITGLQRIAEERTAELAQAQQTVSRLQAQVVELQHSVDNVNKVESRLQAARAEVARLADALDTCDQARLVAQASAAEKERALKEMNTEVIYRNEQIDALRKTISNNDDRIQTLEDVAREKSRLEGTCLGLQRLVQDRESELNAAQQALASAKSDNAQLASELKSVAVLRARADELESQLAERLKSSQAMELEAQKRCAVLAQAQAALAEMESARDAAVVAAREASHAKEALTTRVKSLTDRLADVEEAADETERLCLIETNKLHAWGYETKQQLDSERQANADKVAQLEAATASVERTQKRVEELERKCGSLQSAIDEATATIHALQADSTRLTSHLAAERARAAELAAARDAAEAECEAALNSLRRFNASSVEDTGRLDRALTEARLEAQRCKHELSSAEDEVARLRDDAQRHRDMLAEASRELARRNQVVHELELNVAQLRTAVDDANDRRSSAELKATELEIFVARLSVNQQHDGSTGRAPNRVLSPSRSSAK